MVGDTEVPAIGTIVKWARDTTDGPWMKAEHRDRGRAVHAATLAIDLGDSAQAVMARMPEEWRPFLFAYCEFRQTVAMRWTQIEQPLVHRDLYFAGTPDRVGTMNDVPTLLEIKTGHATTWHAIQTAGQDILIDPHQNIRRRYVVYLTADGKHRLRRHMDTGDYLKFLSALQRYHEAHQPPAPRTIRLREE